MHSTKRLNAVLALATAASSAALGQEQVDLLGSRLPPLDPAALKRVAEADSLINTGNRHMQREQWPEAIAALEQATKIRPGRTDVWYSLSKCYATVGNRRKAIESLRVTIYAPSVEPSDPPLISEGRIDRLAQFVLLLESQDFGEAALVYNKMAERVNATRPVLAMPRMVPTNRPGRYVEKQLRALTYVVLSQSAWSSEPADLVLGKALKLVPDLALAHFFLGEFMAKAQRRMEAIDAYRKADELGRGDVRTAARAALIRMNAGG